MSQQNVLIDSIILIGMNDTHVTPPVPRPPAQPTELDRARDQVRVAYDLDEAVARYRGRDDHIGAGRIQAAQRAHMKRAEVHALLAIADELSRIGLSR